MAVETASQGSQLTGGKQPGIFFRFRERFTRLARREFHRIRRSSLTGVPLLLALIAVTLTGYGLIMVLSASSVEQLAKGSSPFLQVTRQGIFAVAGLVLMAVLAFVPVTWYRNKIVLNTGMVLAVLMQLGVMLIGVEIGGNRNWLQFGSLSIQPSEISKLLLALWMAWVLTQQGNITSSTRKALFPLIFGVIPLVGLILAGHDVGTVMIYALMVVGVLWLAGINYKVLGMAGLLVAIGAILTVVTSSHRLARVLGVLGHCQGSTCDQSQSGLAALATGGFWGVGLGRSRQKYNYLPEAHNDYIFAVIGEELGLLGTLLIILLYLGLIYCVVRIILRSADRFISLAAGTILLWISGQAIINMAMVAGILPVIGVPLPFISYGGSSLVSTLAAMGILIAFARQSPLMPIMEDGSTVYYAGEKGREKVRRGRLGAVVEKENRRLAREGENAGFDIYRLLERMGLSPRPAARATAGTGSILSAPASRERPHSQRLPRGKSPQHTLAAPGSTQSATKAQEKANLPQTEHPTSAPNTQPVPTVAQLRRPKTSAHTPQEQAGQKPQQKQGTENQLPPGLVPLKKIRQRNRAKGEPAQDERD